MIGKIFVPFIVACSVISSLEAARESSFFLGKNQPTHIEVNNRILATINGNPISVCDLMKKMDVIFYKQFPHYAEIPEAKFQFYTVNWKHTLKDLIDKELILADAKEVKLPVSGGDIRQEMEQNFGPNIIANLDKIGLSYDEAQEIIQSDITLRRMMMIRVNQKAMHKVTPQAVLEAYDKFCEENIRLTEWDYFVISVRSNDDTKGAHIANVIHGMLTLDNTPPEEIKGRIASMGLLDDKTTISVSSPYHHNEKEVSETFREALAGMSPNSYSEPQMHKNRNGNSKIYRIFYLENMTPGGVIPLNEVEDKIVDAIRMKAIDAEADAYLKRLREHFRIIDEEILSQLPDDYQPFTLF